MKNHTVAADVPVGDLRVADLAKLPYEDGLFDIALVVGVLEYCPFDYLELGLGELDRVMKPRARVVLDIPNPDHEHVSTMLHLEELLGRQAFVHPRRAFEQTLRSVFTTEEVDESNVMLKYFVRR
jgi:SAM-dependent methyltransferase